MVLLFLFAFFLFLPIRLIFSAILDINEKSLYSKITLFRFFLLFKRTLFLKGLAITDKKGNKKKLLKKGKINIKKAFSIKELQVLFACNLRDDLFYFDTIFNIFVIFYDLFDEKYRFYAKNNPKLKIIAIDGIIYTSIAKIIITVIFSYGVWLWKKVKTKLKKLLTD